MFFLVVNVYVQCLADVMVTEISCVWAHPCAAQRRTKSHMTSNVNRTLTALALRSLYVSIFRYYLLCIQIIANYIRGLHVNK